MARSRIKDRVIMDGKNTSKKHNPVTLLKHFIIAVVIILAVLAVIYRRELTLPHLLSYTPENMTLAFFVMMLVFIMKSVTVVVDLKLLYIASGILFPLPIAIAANLAGVFLSMTLSYVFGRYCIRDSANKIIHRYPKLNRLRTLRAKSDFGFACLLRAVAFLPSDPVSMYLGSVEMPYIPYILGSLTGLLPAMCVTTCIGISIEDPGSRGFWIAVAAFVVITVLAVVLYWLWQRHSSAAAGSPAGERADPAPEDKSDDQSADQ